jgi:recombination protein RecT
MSADLVNLNQIIQTTQTNFNKLAQVHGAVTFLEEASFAMQLLSDNDYLARVARGNPDSLKRAVLNVAIIGLSLNPYKKQAYLVPRKGKVCLDVSYQGEVDVHVEAGAIKYAVAELVYQNDTFQWIGMNSRPMHKFDPFGDRGRLLGGYVIAELPDGSVIATHMSITEIHQQRDRSESFKAGKNSPWITDNQEMCKKTMIRRARKSWPKANYSERARKVEEVLDEANPVLLSPSPEPESPERADLLLNIRTALEIIGKSEPEYIKYLVRICRRDIKALEDLTTVEMKQAGIALVQMVDQKNAGERST